MKRIMLLSLLLLLATAVHGQEKDAAFIRKIYDEALAKGESYEMLRYLTKNIGGRLSGSPQAAAAVEWSRQQMMAYGFDTVYLQPVMVPHWERGEVEKGRIVNSKKYGSMPIEVTALGNSVGTGPKGTLGRLIEVKDFQHLAELGEKTIKGIVFQEVY